MYAIKALVLLTVDHHVGKWVSLDVIVSHAMAPRAAVQRVCDQLADERQLERGVVDGKPCYGVRVDAGGEPELVA